MNKERVLELADFIERNDIEFDMCHSDTCIMGHANRLWNLGGKFYPNESTVRDALDLTANQAVRLFYPDEMNTVKTIPQREDAVRILRKFAETGEVEWRASVMT